MLIMVYGDDSFRVKEKAKEFVAKFIEKHDPSVLNVDHIVFSKKDDLDVPRVVDAITASPFLALKRMVRIDGIFSYVTTKSESETWINFFSSIPESTIVVLVDDLPVKKIEKTELYQRLFKKENVFLYPFVAFSGIDLKAWVQQRAGLYGATLVPHDAGVLIDRAGNDSWRLETEIAKLAAYAGHAPIDSEMIVDLVSADFDENIFEFIDAISIGKPGFGLKKLAEERLAGAEEFSLFGMLARQIRLLLQVAAFLQDSPNASKQEISDTFNIHPFVVQKVISGVQKRDFESICFLHSVVAELDVAMKRGVSSEIAVDRLVARLLDAS